MFVYYIYTYIFFKFFFIFNYLIYIKVSDIPQEKSTPIYRPDRD